MDRKYFYLMALLSVLIFKSTVFAAFETTYMVGSTGSTVKKTVFGLNDTPYLYANLPSSSVPYTLWTTWENPDHLAYFTGFSGNETSVWIPLSGLNEWDKVKKTGAWNIYAMFYGNNNNAGMSSVNFTVVTPEPVSSILFLLGGAALAGRQYKKKKKKNDIR